jgi:hypothetical protein
MTIYIVRVRVVGETPFICGVFDNKELAQEAIDREVVDYGEHSANDFQIIEEEMNYWIG